VCRPQDCIPSPPLLPPQHWGDPDSPDGPWIFNVSQDYFNLNPYTFGLDYGIFAFPQQDTLHSRAESTFIPGRCYPACNDAGLEAQKLGKSELLCRNGSAFNELLDLCRRCYMSGTTKRVVSILPEFQQFLSYCDNVGFVSSSPRPSLTGTTISPPATTSHASSPNSTTREPIIPASTSPTSTITVTPVNSTKTPAHTAPLSPLSPLSPVAPSTAETSAVSPGTVVNAPEPSPSSASTIECSGVALGEPTTTGATNVSPYVPLFTGAAMISARVSSLGWGLVAALLLC
jgi:hypothetical protein